MQLNLALLVVLVCWPLAPAHAYRTAADLRDFPSDARIAWRESPPVVLAAPPTGSTESEVREAIQAALRSWSASPCLDEMELAQGDVDSNAIRIAWIVDWAARGYSASLPGTTEIHYVERGGSWSIESADIYLNDANFLWSASGDGIVDAQAVLTHELGHALGLLHVCEERGEEGAPLCATSSIFQSSTMYPSYSGVGQRVLGTDDLAGLCFLYADDFCETPTELMCDTGTPAAHVGDPCERDTECLSGYCSGAGYCTRRCASSVFCERGYVCASRLGECVAESEAFGGACSSAGECASALCAISSGESVGICTRQCADPQSECPSGFKCKSAGAVSACFPAREASSGCQISGSPARQTGWPWFILLLLGTLRRRLRAQKFCDGKV